MAKKKPVAKPTKEVSEELKGDSETTSEAMSKEETKEVSEVAEPSKKPFKVSCDCPTPLVDSELCLRAEDEKVAWVKFCAHNGISGTDHDYSVDEMTEAEYKAATAKK